MPSPPEGAGLEVPDAFGDLGEARREVVDYRRTGVGTRPPCPFVSGRTLTRIPCFPFIALSSRVLRAVVK